jgi:hypothetical protein
VTLKYRGVEVLGERICEHVVGGTIQDADDAFSDAVTKSHDTKINVARARLDGIFAEQTTCAIVLVERCR